MKKISKAAAAAAYLVAKASANSSCIFAAYQPKLPEQAKKLRRF